MPVSFDFIPAAHSDAGTHRRKGLLVWISHDGRGQPPAGWAEVLQLRGIHWAGLVGYGNDVEGVARSRAAAQAVWEIAGREPLEPLRVWVGGFSGGAKAASLAAAVHPYAFAGALLVGGAGYWRPLAVPEDSRVLAPECAPPPYQVPQRFALVVGEADEWRNPVRAIAKALDEDGYHAATFEARGLGHELPVKGVLELALTHLDGGPCIHCPKCGLVSFNSNDVALRYCGNCHATHEALTHG